MAWCKWVKTKFLIFTSKTQINCLTASAVPWNHCIPASPGVWVAARTCMAVESAIYHFIISWWRNHQVVQVKHKWLQAVLFFSFFFSKSKLLLTYFHMETVKFEKQMKLAAYRYNKNSNRELLISDITMRMNFNKANSSLVSLQVHIL